MGPGSSPPVDSITIRSPYGAMLSQPEEKAKRFHSVFDISSHLGGSHTEFDPKVQEAIEDPSPNALN